MPAARERISFTASFTAAEFGEIQRGLVPLQMEDKWFIYWEEPWLRLHRSWVGTCIYEVRLERSGERCAATETWVNRDSRQYGETNAAYDCRLLDYLIRRLLLAQAAEFPVPQNVPPDMIAVYRHGVVGHARASREPL